MAKHSSKKERERTEPFVLIYRWEYNCPALRALTGDEFRVYFDMRSRYNGSNNGNIVYSSRQAGAAIDKSHNTGARALKRLNALGFIKIRSDSSFGQKRLSREYELTAISLKPAGRSNRLPNGTRDFMTVTQKQIDAMDAAVRAEKARRKKKASGTGEHHSVASKIAAKNVVQLRAK